MDLKCKKADGLPGTGGNIKKVDGLRYKTKIKVFRLISEPVFWFNLNLSPLACKFHVVIL